MKKPCADMAWMHHGSVSEVRDDGEFPYKERHKHPVIISDISDHISYPTATSTTVPLGKGPVFDDEACHNISIPGVEC